MIGTKPTERRFRPLAWQIAPWRDKALIVLLDGRSGTGKSHLGANKIDAYMRKYPGAMGLMVRKTRESMTNSTLLFMDRRVIGDDPYVHLKRQEKRFEYANGSILAYGGMKDEGQRESIRSIGQDGALDFVLAEEAHQLTWGDFEEIVPRMRGKAAYNYYRAQGYNHFEAERRAWVQILLMTNPDTNLHWIYQNLIRGGLASRHNYNGINPYNPESYEGTLDLLTGVRRQRLKEGIWVGAEGMVYDDYRHERHVVERYEIPADWRRLISVDFGFNNPFVAQWWAVSPDDEMILYRELYGTGRLVSDWGADIVRLGAGERISYIVADPADAEGRKTLQRSTGLGVMQADNEILAGIQAVQQRLRIGANGKPRLMFFFDTLANADRELERRKHPTCTLDEITGYVWETARDGKPNKERPVDLHNHGMDAMRYAVMAVDASRNRRVFIMDYGD